MKNKPLLLVSAIPALALLLDGCPVDRDEPVIAGDAKIAAYIRTWSPWSASQVRGEYLSDLIIAFALINQQDGYSLFIPDAAASFANIWNEVAALKAKYPHLRVSFSVGGGSAAGLAGFSAMAANPSKRAAFAANVCKWLKDYNMDGVDIDWEYPVGAPWDAVRYPEDRENYIILLRDLRDALDELGKETRKRYSLSTAIPTSTWFIRDNDVKAAAEIVDALKLMAYDYYGPWSGTTGHNANLYSNPRDPANWSTAQALDAFLDADIPPKKIMLGIAFYGRVWGGVTQGPENGLFQSYRSTPFDGALAWSDIKETYLRTGSGYTRYWDDAAKAPWLYNGDTFISYTDHEQIKLLTDFAKEKKLGGVFVWEYGHDMDADLLKTLAEKSQQ